MELVVVSKTGLFEQPSYAITNYLQPRKDYGDDRRSALKCRCTKFGHKRVLVSALDDIEVNWENAELNIEVVFRPRIDISFFPTAFFDLEMGRLAGNLNLIDDKEDKENSPLTTPVSERRTRPPALLRSWPVGTRVEIVPGYVYRTLFYQTLALMCCYINYNFRASFYQKLISKTRKLVGHV